MDPTLKQGTLLRLSWLVVVLAGLFHFSSGISEVTKAVEEMVSLPCGYNISVGELSQVRVYWQKENAVVLSIVSGDVKVWSEYKNRTFPDITNNLSLVILALRLSDRGTYTCVIQKPERGTFRLEHLTSVMLSIKADFPIPSLRDYEQPSPDLRRITCSTSGGFPKPHLSWLENGEELKAINTTVSQDPETELYAVSSELDFNVTINHSFVCLIKYGGLTVSSTFNWEKPKEDPPKNQTLVIILYSAVGVLLLFGIVGILICRRPRRWRERGRNEAEIEMRRTSCIYTGPAEASG